MIRTMMEGLQGLQRGDEQARQKFISAHPEVIKLSRAVLKREWNRVKDKIEMK